MRVCVPGRMDVMARRHVFVDVRAAVFPVVLWLCLVDSHTLKGCTAAPGCGGAGPVLKLHARRPGPRRFRSESRTRVYVSCVWARRNFSVLRASVLGQIFESEPDFWW